MSWTYKQALGFLTDPLGNLVATGYSGHPPHVNDGDAEQIHDVGPCPRGYYTMGVAYDDPHKGPDVIPLTPVAPFDAFGRTGLLIHGDNFNGDQSASHGCIIMPHPARILLKNSSFRELWVL
jgi:hypothetical protein